MMRTQSRPERAVLVIGITLLTGCGSRGTEMDQGSRERELAAIEELHRRDREASLSGNASALLALWSEDPAALPPGGPVWRGRPALEESLGRAAQARAVWETLEYEQDFQEVRVLGDVAWDWGTYRGRSRNRETGEEVSSSGKLFRILKKAPDGSWRVHRSIWNVDPKPADEASR
ncbi:MAG: DUF4440 domain-containing protein [Gemmatimonadota bacterium]